MDSVEFGKEDSEAKEEANETIEKIEKSIEPKKESKTLLGYAQND